MDKSLRKVVANGLDTPLPLEREYPDVEPTEADIEHLFEVWAEVGRAILIRRKQSNEALQD